MNLGPKKCKSIKIEENECQNRIIKKIELSNSSISDYFDDSEDGWEFEDIWKSDDDWETEDLWESYNDWESEDNVEYQDEDASTGDFRILNNLSTNSKINSSKNTNSKNKLKNGIFETKVFSKKNNKFSL